MKLSIFIIFVTILVGCNSNNNKSIENKISSDLNAKYRNAKLFFGKDFVNHFPEKITKDNITFSEGFSPEFGNLELILIDKIVNSNLISLINEFKEKSIAIYDASDSCLLIVNRFATRNNYYNIELSDEDKLRVNSDCYSKNYPVPNFWHNDFTTEATQCKLPSDFNLYVIESKAGKYFDEKKLTDGRFMPEKWKNGYSKGVAISEERNVIIYWLVIW